MPVIAILRDTLRQLDEVEDFRKEGPVVVSLRREILRAIAELDAAQAIREATRSSPPKKKRGEGDSI